MRFDSFMEAELEVIRLETKVAELEVKCDRAAAALREIAQGNIHPEGGGDWAGDEGWSYADALSSIARNALDQLDKEATDAEQE